MKKAYNIVEAAEAICCSPDVVRAAISEGRLTARKPGKAYIVLDEDLEEWLRNLPVVN
jgi:excisionase family DNA binding protein